VGGESPLQRRTGEVTVDGEVHPAGPGVVHAGRLSERPERGVRRLTPATNGEASAAEGVRKRRDQGRLPGAVDPFDRDQPPPSSRASRHGARGSVTSGRHP
jgi:hypothetical protein